MKLPIYLFAALVTLSGCATSSNKKLDQKMSDEPTVTSRSDLRAEARNTIYNATNLTQEQKEKLTELRFSVSAQTDAFNQQSLELRSILLKDLLSSDYNAKEVGLIKSRMRKLEDRRLSMIFDATDKANVILGRQAANNHAIVEEFFGRREHRE